MNPSPTDLASEVSPRVRGLFLKNLGDFQTELARIQAGFIPALAIWGQRKEAPALVFRSLRRVQDLRIRSRELGTSFQDMHLSLTVAGRPILEALCEARNPADLMGAGLILIPGVLAGAIDGYLKRNEGVYDLPSVQLLEADRDELRAQARWASDALAETAAQLSQAPNPAWLRQIESLCANLPELLQTHAVRSTSAQPQREARRIGVLPLPNSALPAGFYDLEFGPQPVGAEESYAGRARYHAVNFLQEVQAADSCASLLFEAPDLPWDFYFDLGRHMWDESRHAMFGERKLADLGETAQRAGLSGTAYAMRQTLAPLDRYAALSTQEADAFPGKHAGLKEAVANGDAVSAMMWSYDIADETQHVRYGNKWIPVMIEKLAEARSYDQLKEDARNWRSAVLAEAYRPAAQFFGRPPALS